MAQGVSRPAKSRTSTGRSAHHAPSDDTKQRNADRDNATTIAYIKRVLCSSDFSDTGPTAEEAPLDNVSDRPLRELLPPLTSSRELDVQLYAFVAVILDNFVHSWYKRITPDQHFTNEVVQIIARCTQGIERRLCQIDLIDVLLDELPALLIEHVDAVRSSRGTEGHNVSTVNDIRARYSALRPHVALLPVPSDAASASVQQGNEASWSLLLVNRILPHLLPPEDLRNPCLDVLVSEIFAEMIIRNGICGKVSESWLIWDGITKALYAARPQVRKSSPSTPSRDSRLDRFGLLASESTQPNKSPRSAMDRLGAVTDTFWTTLQAIMTTAMLVRSVVLLLLQASSLPLRGESHRRGHKRPTSLPTVASPQSLDADVSQSMRPVTRPIVAMHIWACVAQLLVLEQRMPWFAGLLSLLQHLAINGPGKVCCTNSRLDRLLASTINEKAFRPYWLPSVLATARNAVFPDNALAPGRDIPTIDETLAMRSECARVIVEAIPGIARSRFFATHDTDLMRQDIEVDLDLFADSYVNKHLLIRVLELLFVRLFPELTEASAEDH